jgi:uncharacterized protein YvpB
MKPKNNKNLNILIASIPLVVLIMVGVYFVCSNDVGSKEVYFYKNAAVAAVDKNIDLVVEKDIVLPDTINLDVPFIAQAPFGSWRIYPFNETCEEASVLMLHYYLSGIKKVDENITKQELLALVDFENKKYGFSDDTTTMETVRFIKDYYGYDVQISYDISVENIKKELAKGNPVIVPTAGRLLHNPHFVLPGPLYHMLVIKGYDSDGFITNDPGTYVAGSNYKYSYKVLENAIRGFNKSNKSMDEKGAMLILSPHKEN